MVFVKFGNSIQTSVNLGMVQLLPEARVVSVKPSAISIGHSRVSIIGSNFVPGIRATCRFNKVLLTEGFADSQSMVTCDVPKINSTLIFVEISFDGQAFISSINSSFVIELGTIVHFFHPETCRANSKCFIDIFGENFSKNVLCSLEDTLFSIVEIFVHNSSHITCSFQTGNDVSLSLSVCNPHSQCHTSRIQIFDDLISFRIDNQVIIARERVALNVQLSRKWSLQEPHLLIGNHSFKCMTANCTSLTCFVIVSLPGKYFVELQERSIVSSISTETWVHVIELPNVASSKWILPTGKRTLIPVSPSVLSVPNTGCFIASQSISHSAQVIGYESFCPVFSNISGNFTVYISVMDTVTSRILGIAIFLDPIRILSVLLSDVNPKSGC